MTCPILTFFNNKGGVGKTSLIYHLAWMFVEMGKRVVCADIDPQANLTAAFLDEERIGDIWDSEDKGTTIYRCVKPLSDVEDISAPRLVPVNERLALIPGDVGLSNFEDALSEAWPKSLGDANIYRPLRILSAFWQVMQMAGQQTAADIILVDIGPNLGAINRSVLIATDFVVIPLGADLYSLQGLKNLGPTLRSWRRQWQRRRENWRENLAEMSPVDQKKFENFQLPQGSMQPLGYLCQQHLVRLDRPVRAYDKWVQRIPSVYRECVLEEAPIPSMSQEEDPYCLATIRHYRSLVPLAQEVRKPIFNLTGGDGAIGSHANAVRNARDNFHDLAMKITEKMHTDS
ncbi:MAG: AAA family ATPase [Desulfovibrionaceae bacterium]|nr:AAA family ATPase [Desulfovibrionaceae bacterium]